LTLENLSFVEKYRIGRLSMCLYLNVAGHTCKIQYSALANHQGAVGKNHRPDFSIDVFQGNDGNRGNQQPMFVEYVETVQGTEGIIPSIAIGFYNINDDVYDVGSSRLYFSPINSCFKFLSCISEGEIRVTGRRSSCRSNDFTGERLDYLELDDAVSRILLFIYVKTAKVGIDERGEYPIEFLDMLFGPFDL
jgi:hypothetical protein